MIESSTNLILKWTELFRISELNYPDRKDAGVYIWGFTIENVFIPYYVGIADNIVLRIYEHLDSIISGRYTIYHKTSLANFKVYKKDSEVNEDHGIVYYPNWPKSFSLFLQKRKELQPHIDFMLDTFTFSYSIVDKLSVSTFDLSEVEKICIKQIGKENLANTRGGEQKNIKVSHTGCSIITSLMNDTKQ